MTPAPLPESSPSRHGVDADGIDAFLDAVEDIELHSLMILRHGHVIASGWWEPYGPDRPHLLYSLSKSFTSTAAGLAAAEGLLDLNAPVLSYFPELDADVTDSRSRAMLVRHIASMSSGHLTDTWPAARDADPHRPVRGFLLMPPEEDPGTVFTYNQSCTYTLASIIQRVTGQPLIAYLRPRLFDVIGIGAADWEEFPPGQALGFSGLYATTDAIARLGQLYLSDGQWHGHQVIPREWVAEATRAHVATRPDATPDWRQGYGFQFWMSRHGYRGDGACGQFCLVLPEHDAVVAITAGTENMQGILDAVWTHVLPAFRTPDASGTDASDASGTDRAATGADAALAKRLAQLRLPAHAATVRPRGPWPDTAIVLTPAGGVCEAFPSLRRVRVADQNVTLSDDTLSVELRLVDGDWHVADSPVPAAASGGWTDPGTLAIDVVFLETPHRLSLTCSLGERTFRVRWHTRPLSATDSLSRLRSPAV
jgi:CubicO group peptidase (beta-lactamase class C family)